MIAYNPIVGGLLSGKHRRESGPLPGTRFTHPNAGPTYQERYWHERELDTVDALRALADEAGMSMVGATRPEQLDEVVAVLDKTLDAGLKARLDALTHEYRWGDDIR